MDQAGLDVEGRAAQRGPGQSGDHADAGHPRFLPERRFAQIAFQIGFIHRDRSFGLSSTIFTALLRTIRPAFPDCAPRPRGRNLNDLGQRAILDLDAIPLQAAALQQLRPQVVAGDFAAFGGDVAGQADGFHAVEQRRRNGVELLAVQMNNTLERSNRTSR